MLWALTIIISVFISIFLWNFNFRTLIMEFSVGLKIILKLKLAMHIGGYVGHGFNANHMHYTDSSCDANVGQNSGESMMYFDCGCDHVYGYESIFFSISKSSAASSAVVKILKVRGNNSSSWKNIYSDCKNCYVGALVEARVLYTMVHIHQKSWPQQIKYLLN